MINYFLLTRPSITVQSIQRVNNVFWEFCDGLHRRIRKICFLPLFCTEFLFGCVWVGEKLQCGVRDGYQLITQQPTYAVTFQMPSHEPGTFHCDYIPPEEAVTIQSCSFTLKGEVYCTQSWHMYKETETKQTDCLFLKWLPPHWQEYQHFLKRFFLSLFRRISDCGLFLIQLPTCPRTNPQWRLAECNLHVHCPHEHSGPPTPPSSPSLLCVSLFPSVGSLNQAACAK